MIREGGEVPDIGRRDGDQHTARHEISLDLLDVFFTSWW
jgi:hypothetical protein